MTRILLRLLPCLAILFAAGCSTFEKRFTEATKAPVKVGQFAGAYEGTWKSASHPGGGGNLRCILSQVNGTDFRADFHATWHGLSSEHSVMLHAKPPVTRKPSRFITSVVGGVVKGTTPEPTLVRGFEGMSKLRTIIGAGTYTCKGQLERHPGTVTMSALYDATYDRGSFVMSRAIPHVAQAAPRLIYRPQLRAA